MPQTCNTTMPRLTTVSAATVAMLSSRRHIIGPSLFALATVGGNLVAGYEAAPFTQRSRAAD